MIGEKDLFVIGEIVRVHGVKGKLEIGFTNDVFHRAASDFLFLRIDGLPVPFLIESYSFKGNNRALIKFEGINSTDAATNLLGSEVLFPLSQVPERVSIPDEWSFLNGFEVYGMKEGLVGKVIAVDAQSANIVLQIERPGGREVLLPLHPELLVKLDDKDRKVIMNLPDGILTVND